MPTFNNWVISTAALPELLEMGGNSQKAWCQKPRQRKFLAGISLGKEELSVGALSGWWVLANGPGGEKYRPIWIGPQPESRTHSWLVQYGPHGQKIGYIKGTAQINTYIENNGSQNSHSQRRYKFGKREGSSKAGDNRGFR